MRKLGTNDSRAPGRLTSPSLSLARRTCAFLSRKSGLRKAEKPLEDRSLRAKASSRSPSIDVYRRLDGNDASALLSRHFRWKRKDLDSFPLLSLSAHIQRRPSDSSARSSLSLKPSGKKPLPPWPVIGGRFGGIRRSSRHLCLLSAMREEATAAVAKEQQEEKKFEFAAAGCGSRVGEREICSPTLLSSEREATRALWLFIARRKLIRRARANCEEERHRARASPTAPGSL